MGFVNGVNLLPATGEFTYAMTARQGRRVSEPRLVPINFYFGNLVPPTQTVTAAPPATDITFALSTSSPYGLLSTFPACQTVAVVVAWFGNNVSAQFCQIYPSTTYQNNGSVLNPATGQPYATIPNAFTFWNGSAWVADQWRCSSLNETTVGLKTISSDAAGNFVYGGTPSDQSIVECISYLKNTLGLRVVFYPFILMDTGDPNQPFPWRGRIGYFDADGPGNPGGQNAVATFFGTCVTTDFSRDTINKTVTYNGPNNQNNIFDFTYRRFILHYANLCVVAGGVDLFLIGSEFRGLERIRGTGWSVPGTVDGSGKAIWDYPFIGDSTKGLIKLANDVRSVFDGAGLSKDTTGLHNLISYAADWSSWMGWQHGEANPPLPLASGHQFGQWPHLDQLWASPNIDLVCFDNYMPLSDWTTGSGAKKSNGQSDNLDVANWSAQAPRDEVADYGKVTEAVLSSKDYGLASDGIVTSSADYGIVTAAPAWPPDPSVMGNLGLEGTPMIYSKAYLKANIEGGDKFNWFYFISDNLGRGLDPLGSGLQVSLPAGDHVTQSRNRYFPQQEPLGNKQLRWWWNNTHKVLYDNFPTDNLGEVPHGPDTQWVAKSKPIVFTEYGVPSCDRGTNQPNVFFDPKSIESFTPFWSIWRNTDGAKFLPQPDQELQLLALQAFYEYWFVDGHNTASAVGVKMIEPAFCSVWNWDARPFPTFPQLTGVWGDAGNWQAGNWLNGKGPFLTPPIPDQPFVPGPYPAFPALSGKGWSVHYKPEFATSVASHISGRESRFNNTANQIWEIELVFDILKMDDGQDLQAIAGFYERMKGQDLPFTFPVPDALGAGPTVNCRFADDSEDLEEFMNLLWQVQSLKIRTVKE